MSEVRFETVEEFLARGGQIEVVANEIIEGRKPEVPTMDVYDRYAAWRNHSE